RRSSGRQYVLWLAPLICLAMPANVERRGVRGDGTRWRDVLLDTSEGAPLALGVLTVIIAGLSFLVFPISYGWLVSSGPAVIPASILVVRNLLCILVAVIAVRWGLRVSRPGAPGAEPHPSTLQPRHRHCPAHRPRSPGPSPPAPS